MQMPDDVAYAAEALAERTRALNERRANPAGDYVLYWMTTALRASIYPSLSNWLELKLKTMKALSRIQIK